MIEFWSWIIKKMEKWPRWVVLGLTSVSTIAFVIVLYILICTLSFLVRGPRPADVQRVETEVGGYP